MLQIEEFRDLSKLKRLVSKYNRKDKKVYDLELYEGDGRFFAFIHYDVVKKLKKSA